MAYYTARYVLHRSRSLPDSPQSFSNTELSSAQRRSKALLLESADSITHLTMELQSHDIDCNLPISAITVLCPALSIHILNMKSQSQDARRMAIANFQICMKTMNKLKELYSAAEVTISFLKVSMSKASRLPISNPITSTISPDRQQEKSDLWTIPNSALPFLAGESK